MNDINFLRHNTSEVISMEKYSSGFITKTISILFVIFKGIFDYAKKFIKNNLALDRIDYDLAEITNEISKLTQKQFQILIIELFKQQGEYDKVKPIRFPLNSKDLVLTKNINGCKELTFV